MKEAVPVRVEPIYGWGWTAGAGTLETPEPFKAILVRRGAELAGEVVEVEHEFSGRAVSLSRRHTEWDGLVNVQVTDASGTVVSGYAEIPVETMI